MRLRMLVVPAVVLAVALPAQARAGDFSGVVVAKQPQRGTLLLAGARGAGLTIRGGLARAVVGQRVRVHGVRLHDGTVRSSRLQVLAHVRTARLRGTVIRRIAKGTLLASGRSVVMIRVRARRLASVSDHVGLRPGDIASFRIRFDDNDLVEASPPTQLAQAATAQIEGTIDSLSPFVVSLEGVPLTITLPAGTTLPATLAVGQRIEMTVQVGSGNTLTLVAIEQVETENPAAQAEEVEVNGFVTSSTAAELVVDADGTLFTFVAPTGTTLPVLATGTPVEVRGVQQNGTITLTRLRTDGNDGGGGSGGDDGDHGGSGGGGGEDGGGH